MFYFLLFLSYYVLTCVLMCILRCPMPKKLNLTKPVSVRLSPQVRNTVKELAIYLICIILENNFNFRAWAIFDLLEAFLPLVFDKKSAALEGESGL